MSIPGTRDFHHGLLGGLAGGAAALSVSDPPDRRAKSGRGWVTVHGAGEKVI